ncbi:hypothetical protein [Candidatus Paracaedibacter symbiosus]|uniref:hypothetical protein n=1 Tax=Candidatus Paracaedibacter symbiosus TaxID=244582 RepID=UPI0018DEC991|nr:hypothetical protein [Candidatus Paracaedibacter symbiosus]
MLDNPDKISEWSDFAQKNFLRPKSSERLDKKAISHYKQLCASLPLDDKKEILNQFNQLGHIDTINPKSTTPNHILIMGSTVQNMRKRIMFLVKLIKDQKINITPETKIVALVGERPLFESETESVLLDSSPYETDPTWKAPKNLPSDEREAARFIWGQLKLPEILRKKGLHFVDTEKKENESRAQTEDCIQTWLKIDNVKGEVTMISSNPYVGYQQSVAKLAIKKAGLENEVHLEGVGSAASFEEEDIEVILGLLLDNLAREIYTEKQIKELG